MKKLNGREDGRYFYLLGNRESGGDGVGDGNRICSETEIRVGRMKKMDGYVIKVERRRRRRMVMKL